MDVARAVAEGAMYAAEGALIVAEQAVTLAEQAVLAVLRHGQYVLGPEVAELERQLASFCGARHCVSCANGTDALLLALMAEGVGAGDAVFVPAFTFVATAEVPVLVGATPVFVDVRPDTFNIDAESLEAAIGEAKRRGLKPRCIIPVDLYGQPADYKAIVTAAASHAHVEMQARYDAKNPPALKRLVANGAKLAAFDKSILKAAHDAAMQLYDELSAKNPNWKKVYADYAAFRDEQNLWFRFTEATFDNFMQTGRGAPAKAAKKG